ncbi:MAG: MaoC family dehydratase N-terminal domain-containing protein [Lachnospiraceae bacterium]|nr:MaoC family dehydratase N-terminal domain-containing protein [Lachnospiraceae bacterium]
MYFDDFKLNETIDIKPVIIDKGEMMDFAKRYDNIPLHIDEEYAKNTYFGRIIAPGVMSFMAVWANYLEIDLAGEELIAGKSTKIEWFKPVFAEDVLTAKAVITALTERNEKNGIVELTFYVKNQNDELVLTDVTEMIVKKRRK